MTDFLTFEIISAVTDHMNGDHAADNVVICRGVGGRREVTAATMAGLTADRITFSVETPSGDDTVDLPFNETLTERAQIRAEVARMFHESVALLED